MEGDSIHSYPSKCDCDYKEEKLSLDGKGGFVLTHQRGWINPEIYYEYGTWEVKKGEWLYNRGWNLILTITHQKGGPFALLPVKKNKGSKRVEVDPHTVTFLVLDHQLNELYGKQIWEGISNPTILYIYPSN